MSEQYYARFVAKTTDEEHAVFAAAFEGNADFEEFEVSRGDGMTIIQNEEESVSRTDDIEEKLMEMLRERGMPVVFAFDIDQMYGGRWFGTLSREGEKNFNVEKHVLEMADGIVRELKEKDAASDGCSPS